MKIGYVNIYSFRPHVEHLAFIEQVMKNSGHESFFLTCDASVETCYVRNLKQKGKFKECSKCIAGGVRSYFHNGVSSISRQSGTCNQKTLDKIALSSSCTLHRTESEREWDDDEVVNTRRSMYSSVEDALASTKEWIKKNQLDAVVCFNGRMDLTRAVTYACEELKVPYITHERTWFGDGLTLVPNANCLSLSAQCKMSELFKDKPLAEDQARIAGKFIGERFLQKNSLEWRLYNKNPEPANWPISRAGKRILVLPSSKNEFAGHDEWKSGWIDNTSAIDDFIDVFGFSHDQLVVRCHPNWGENIGKVTGARSLSHYKEWASKKGVYLISSEEKASTYDLIQQADIVIMNGGSSAVEAGACGKQVVCLGPSTYQSSGFSHVYKSRADMKKEGSFVYFSAKEIQQKTLRFIYLRSHRFPQFVNFVKAVETTKYKYFEGADPGRIERIIRTGEVEPDDERFASSTEYEDEVINLINEKNWEKLSSFEQSLPLLKPISIERRFGFRWIDGFRSKLARGDR